MIWAGLINVKTTMIGDTIKNKFCGFFLEKCECWLKEKEVNMDHLKLDLYNGRVQFSQFELDAAYINQQLSCYNLPFEIVDCFVGCLDVRVPWSSIFSDSSEIEISNLEITLRRCNKNTRKESNFPNSMKSSEMLAEECIENDKTSENHFSNMPKYENLQEIACAFETILNKTRGTLKDTTVCFEHIHEKYTTIFELKIAKVEYHHKDEELKSNFMNNHGDFNSGEHLDKEIESVVVKNFVFYGVKLFMRIDGELTKPGSTNKKSVDEVLLIDLVGQQKLKFTIFEDDETSIKSRFLIEPQIEGINVVLCPQIIRYLCKVVCEPSSASEVSLSTSVQSTQDVLKNEEFLSCDSDASWISRKYQSQPIRDTLMSAELHLKISFISLVVLHTDKIDDDYVDDRRGNCWHDYLRGLDEGYFKVVKEISHEGVMKTTDLVELRNKYSAALDKSHFSLLIKQTELKISENNNIYNVPPNDSPLNIELNFGLVDLSEVIMDERGGDDQRCNWLSFKESQLIIDEDGNICILEPSIKLKFSSVQLVMNQVSSPSHLFVVMTMSRCSSEVDITILNRIHDLRAAIAPLLNQPLDYRENLSFEKVNFALECYHWSPIMRFPKVGPIEGLEFNRMVHDEFLLVEILKFNFKMGVNLILGKLDSSEILFSSAKGKLIVKNDTPRLFSIKSQSLPSENSYDWSRIMLKFNPKSKMESSSSKKESSTSPLGLGGSSRAPFSSKRRTFKDRELVEPSERHEMLLHLEDEVDTPIVDVVVSLQQLVFYVPKKNVLDHLMNRLLNDLHVWKLVTHEVEFDSRSSLPSNVDILKSDGNREDEINENEQLDESENLKTPRERNRNIVSILVNIRGARIAIEASDAQNTQEFALGLGNLSVVCIPCYLGNPESWYLGVQSEALEFCKSIDNLDKSRAGHEAEVVLTKIVQMSRDKFGLEEIKSTKDALSLTILAKKDGKGNMHHKLAVSVRNCILHHLEPQKDEPFWIQQLMDIFTAIGQEGANSNASPSPLELSSTSELHISLKNCAIEYKPPQLNYHMVLMTESVHFTRRNDLDEGKRHEVSVFVEDTGLFLSRRYHGNRRIDLRKDFVCVADINSLDLTMNQRSKYDMTCPSMSITASMNKLNIRTCCDSFAALSKIIIQLANTKFSKPSQEQMHRKLLPSKEAVMKTALESEERLKELLEDAAKTDYTFTSRQVPNYVQDRRHSHVNCYPTSNEIHRRRLISDRLNVEEKPIINVLASSSTVCNENISCKSWSDVLCDEQRITTDSSPHDHHHAPTAHLRYLTQGSQARPDPANISSIPLRRDENLNFVENHFKKPERGASDFENDTHLIPMEKYYLHDTSITWCIYGGKDLNNSGKEQQKNGQRNERFRQRGIPWNKFCGPARDQDVLMELHLNKLQFLHEVYPEGQLEHSRDMLFVKEVEVIDKLLKSDINKFLHPYYREITNRPINSKMVRISSKFIRDKTFPSKKECILKISLTPIKLNIDQHSLAFLCEFINGTTERVVSRSQKRRTSESSDEVDAKEDVKEIQPIYFRSVKFSPETIIKMDYRGKIVDKSSFTGFLAGVLQLDQSEIILKRIVCGRGIRGVDKLGNYLLEEWMNDIKTNQIASLLKSIGPMGMLINIAHGVKNLICLPVEEYKRDGSVIMGLQKGAYSFASCTLVSSLDLVYKSFHLLQSLSQFAQDAVSLDEDGIRNHETRQRIKHPEDLREGLIGACAIFKEGLTNRATEMRSAVSRKQHQKGVGGAIGGVLLQVPQVVIDPILVVSKATTNVLEGARNQLRPEVKKEEMEKWKSRRNHFVNKTYK